MCLGVLLIEQDSISWAISTINLKQFHADRQIDCICPIQQFTVQKIKLPQLQPKQFCDYYLKYVLKLIIIIQRRLSTSLNKQVKVMKTLIIVNVRKCATIFYEKKSVINYCYNKFINATHFVTWVVSICLRKSFM